MFQRQSVLTKIAMRSQVRVIVVDAAAVVVLVVISWKVLKGMVELPGPKPKHLKCV